MTGGSKSVSANQAYRVHRNPSVLKMAVCLWCHFIAFIVMFVLKQSYLDVHLPHFSDFSRAFNSFILHHVMYLKNTHKKDVYVYAVYYLTNLY